MELAPDMAKLNWRPPGLLELKLLKRVLFCGGFGKTGNDEDGSKVGGGNADDVHETDVHKNVDEGVDICVHICIYKTHIYIYTYMYTHTNTNNHAFIHICMSHELLLSNFMILSSGCLRGQPHARSICRPCLLRGE